MGYSPPSACIWFNRYSLSVHILLRQGCTLEYGRVYNQLFEWKLIFVLLRGGAWLQSSCANFFFAVLILSVVFANSTLCSCWCVWKHIWHKNGVQFYHSNQTSLTEHLCNKFRLCYKMIGIFAIFWVEHWLLLQCRQEWRGYVVIFSTTGSKDRSCGCICSKHW